LNLPVIIYKKETLKLARRKKRENQNKEYSTINK